MKEHHAADKERRSTSVHSILDVTACVVNLVNTDSNK
jgi:hypothetical protein